MEQDENVYEYLMGPEVFRFECRSEEEAEKFREYALMHFQEKLGALFAIDALRGPKKAGMPSRMVTGSPELSDSI